MNKYDLSQKHILFVGGQTGLDKAILALLHECMSVNPERHLVVYENLTIGEIEADIKDIVKREGAFDGVVFNVVHSDFRPLQFVKPELVNQITNDNYAVFIEVVRALKKSKGLNDGASIVAMSSISSSRAMKAKMAFCASKAALDAAVRCLAVELADRDIRVNSIQKGSVDADAEKSHIQDVMAVRSDAATQDNTAPLGIVKANEIAQMVAFLLSDAVKTITGTSIVIDGGYLA
ncbi:MAG: SDR family oxidoreductase [Bacteroidales bacterium]|nr:SDR family oxidoreductase [Bacteroidales bacterium]